MMFPRIEKGEVLALDTETTGLHWWEHRVFAFSVSWATHDAYYDIRDNPRALDWLRDTLQHARRVVMHNAKFDIHMLRECGVQVPVERATCTMINAALIDEHLKAYNLDFLGKGYVGVGKTEDIWQELADIFGGRPTKDAQITNLHRAPVELAAKYAKQDTRTTLLLDAWQQQELEQQELVQVSELEHELLEVLVDIEREGVRVDLEAAENAARQLKTKIGQLQGRLNKMAGFEVNVNPSNSLKRLVNVQERDGQWVAKDGTLLSTTEGGNPQVDALALERMKMPEAALVLQIRRMRKTVETFLEGHVLGHHVDGVIHANYNQTKSENDRGTGTGRLSVNSPALQQIHKRDPEIASVVRAVFVPDAGCEWRCRDWSQMDFRMFAHYARVPEILKRYEEDPYTDFHGVVAELTGLPRAPTRESRGGNAKQINLGNVFGMGGGRMALEMGLPYTTEIRRGREFLLPGEEATAVLERYHKAIPGIRRILKKADSLAKSRGFVRTITGRRIRFPGGRFTHKAGGLVFQGSAADALKVKLVEVHRYLKSCNGSRLMLNVHDEFDYCTPVGAGDTVSEEVQRIVEAFGPGDRLHFIVPIRSSEGIGTNWWEASK